MSAGIWLGSAATETDPAARAKVTAAYLQSPMIFEMNSGQSDPQVKALARGSRYGLFLTSSESVFVLDAGAKGEAVVRVQNIGANPAPQVRGIDRLASVSNYYVGRDQSKWRKNVANYARVKYDSIYPGIDLVYYGDQQQLEYDYVVAPGADPNCIQLAIHGAGKLRIDRYGDLLLETRHGAIRQHRPVIYQKVNGVRHEIAGGFIVHGNRLSFQVGGYDHKRELIIDPSLVFLTYLGGSGTDVGRAITVATASGVTVVAGSTSSANFPTATPLYSYTGEADGFLSVFDPTGAKLLNSTYIGGTGGVNVVSSIAIDNFEIPSMLYVAGYTTSKSFSVVHAAQPAYGGGGADGWVAQILLQLTIISFNPPQYTLTTSIGFATYLGGSATDEILGVAMDQNTKDVFVTGFTTSTNFPATPGVLQGKNAGGEDAFLTRYASGVSPETTSAGTMLFSTYFGGTGTDVGNAIAVYTNTGTGVLTTYIAGTTTSGILPAAVGASERVAGTTTSSPSRAFLTAMNATGTSGVFTEFIGSSSKTTKGNAVTVDTKGTIYIAGNTNDSALPVVNAVQSKYAGGGSDGFAGAYNSSGTPTFLTYWGGSGYDIAEAVGVFLTTTQTSTNINLFIAGYTTGKTFPLLNAVQGTYGGGSTDGFVAMFSSTNGGSNWTEGYSTFLGGTGTDIIYGLAVGTSGNARVTGLTTSTNGIATAGGYQTMNAGGYDAFAAEIQTTP